MIRSCKIHKGSRGGLTLSFYEDGVRVGNKMGCGTKKQARNFRAMFLEGRLKFAAPGTPVPADQPAEEKSNPPA
jgi:hypothetical protein